MTRKAGVSIGILIVLVLISLFLAGGGFYLFQKERRKTSDLETRLAEVNTKQRITEAKLKESEKLISGLQLKLEEDKLQMDTLGSDLQQEKAAKLEALAKLEQLKLDLEQQKGLRLDLEKKFNQAQDELRLTQAQLKELESQKIALESQIKDLEMKSEGVELGKIVVSPEPTLAQTSSPTPSFLEGKVLVVNKDYNFAVINLGSKDGINLGDEFSVYRNDKYIGDVKIEKVHDAMAAAGFVSSDIKDKISEGDKVVQKVK